MSVFVALGKFGNQGARGGNFVFVSIDIFIRKAEAFNGKKEDQKNQEQTTKAE